MHVRRSFVKSFGILIVAALLLAVMPAGKVMAQTPLSPTVWVDDDFTDATPGWAVDHFATIQDGIDAVANGDTVSVAAGKYEENVVVSNKYFTLVGQVGDYGMPIAVLEGSLSINNPELTTGFTTIDNIYFIATSTTKKLLTLKNFNGGLIKDCIFQGTEDFLTVPTIGVYLDSGTKVNNNLTVEDSIFKDGLYLGISGYANDITVKNSKFTKVKSGINHMGGGGNLDVQDSYFLNKPVSDGDSYGIRYTAGNTAADKMTITGSRFEIDDSLGFDPVVGDYHTSIYSRGNGLDTLKVEGNTILGGVVNTSTTTTLDASLNWWGSPCGPTNVIGDVIYAPWYIDEAMSTTSDGTEYTFPSGMVSAEINAIVACAAPNSTLIFDGEYEASVKVPADRHHLTFLLKDETILKGDVGYLFYVDGDYIKIEGESYGGAKLVPTNGWHAICVGCGYPEGGGLIDFILDGVEIDGAFLENQSSGAGIYFSSDVTDVQILNNYIHDLLWGEGYPSAVMALERDIEGVFEIQGNLFQNVGPNDCAEVYGPIDAKYNSWGEYDVADGQVISPAYGFNPFEFTPWTHVDLYLESSGTVHADQVVKYDQITYTVYANFKNTMGADFTLTFDEASLAHIAANDQIFDVFDLQKPLKVVGNSIHYLGYNILGTAVSGEDVALFSVTFEAKDNPGVSALDFDEATDIFSMAPGYGPSTNIYASALEDRSVTIIELPTLSSADMEGPYIAGLMQEFHVQLVNPAGGAPFSNVLVKFVMENTDLSDIFSFEYLQGSTWLPLPLSQDGADVVGVFGPSTGFPITAPYDATSSFRIIFMETGSYDFIVSLFDLSATPNWELAKLTGTAVVNGEFDVTGTVSMQGRSVRSGVPLTLTAQSAPVYGPFDTTSIAQISDNVLFAGVNGGVYEVTTLQPRYLNVTADLNKQFSVAADVILAALELKGGNAQWSDNIVDVLDAGVVGGFYGTGTISDDGDVNFDNRVNIQDLALVGGNYDLTSEVAYGNWIGHRGDVAGVLSTSPTGAVSGTLTGDFDLTISGQVTAYVNNVATFSGTVTGDISGDITATINENGIGTMFGSVTNTGLVQPVSILGIFPKTGIAGDFVGQVITSYDPIFVESMTLGTVSGLDTVVVGSTLQMTVAVNPAGALDDTIWSIWTGPGAEYGEASIDMHTGVLTGEAVGKVVVVAKALDGSLKDATKVIWITTP